ncbi:MAG: ribbon-helix-helix domain-containing protein [Anaerolineae bacterium]|nr:MAG: ribbon-helix-helix domain-containing protein [Anaerolineae bacterium]
MYNELTLEKVMLKMTTLSKRPLQVYLRPDQVDALRALARKRDVSLAELVREGVDRVIADLPIEDDPLWDIVDLGASGIRDMAANHDRYLVDGERADNQYGV